MQSSGTHFQNAASKTQLSSKRYGPDDLKGRTCVTEVKKLRFVLPVWALLIAATHTTQSDNERCQNTNHPDTRWCIPSCICLLGPHGQCANLLGNYVCSHFDKCLENFRGRGGVPRRKLNFFTCVIFIQICRKVNVFAVFLTISKHA